MAFSPHLIDGKYSPLSELILRAIEQYGDFDAGSVRGEITPMFVNFANMIVEDVNMHPYMRPPLSPVEHYTSEADTRSIPDPIILHGLLAQYAIQQQAEGKMQLFVPRYYRTLNAQLWMALNGNTDIRMRPTDGGSRLKDAPQTSKTNGLPTA